MQTQNELISWLVKCGKLNVRAVSVRIGKREWQGARYTTLGKYTSDMQACTHGDKKPGDTYTTESVYCIGKRPMFKRHTCFPNAQDGVEWYVAGYCDNVPKGKEEFTPFGVSFILAPWSVPSGEAIDAHEPNKYNREAITITQTTN